MTVISRCLAFLRVVLPSKRDLAIGEVHDPVIGDGDAMRVAGQVLQDMFGPAEGRLGVDDPVLTEQRSQETHGRLVICGKWFQSARKRELLFAEMRVFNPAMNLPRKTRLRTLTGRKNG